MFIVLLKVLGVIFCTLSTFYGIHLIKKVEYYAWNMPEAYMPAKLGGILMFAGGVLLGLLITPSH